MTIFDKEKSMNLAKMATEKLSLSGNIPKEKLEVEFQKAYKEFFELINQAIFYDSTNTYAFYWKGKVELQNELFVESLNTFEQYLEMQPYDFSNDHYWSVNKAVFLLKKKLGLTNFEKNLNTLLKISEDRIKLNQKNADNLTLKLAFFLYSGNKPKAIEFIKKEKENLGNESYFLELVDNFSLQPIIDNIKEQI